MKAIFNTDYKSAYFICLLLLAISLPLSKFMMSVFQFALLIIWLWEGCSIKRSKEVNSNTFSYLLSCAKNNFLFKTKAFLENKFAILAAALFLLYLIGVVYKPNWAEAVLELKGKLPILGLALIIGSMPILSQRQKQHIILWFTFAVFVAVIFGYIKFIQNSFTDPRELVLFVSPVRFSLMSCFSIFSVSYYIIKDKHLGRNLRIFLSLQLLMILGFLFLIESIIGFIILLTLIFVVGILYIRLLKSVIQKIGVSFLILIIPIISLVYLKSIHEGFYNVERVSFKKLDSYTIKGEAYIHDTINFGIEDGNFIGLYLAENEMKVAWNHRSNIKYDSKDLKSQPIRKTIIRFLNSKGLRKDGDAISRLTNQEIRYIELGVANINYIYYPGIKTRVSKILFGFGVYKRTQNPNGNSLMQRLEYWRNSWEIFKKNPWVGVGYTNLPDAFAKQYLESNTKLELKNQMETHNQYLLVLAGFGLLGFIWFIVCIFAPILINHHYQDYHYLIFIIIIAVSMFTEDTLQTQVGVTFFAFFNSVLLLGKKRNTIKLMR